MHLCMLSHVCEVLQNLPDSDVQMQQMASVRCRRPEIQVLFCLMVCTLLLERRERKAGAAAAAASKQ